MPKRTLRASTLARRRGLTPQQVAGQSLALQKRFLDLPEFRWARVLALYAPIHHEVETAAVAEAALLAGKTLLYPAVVGHDLQFCEVRALSELTPGRYGIPEPSGEPCDPGAADIIVVPGEWPKPREEHWRTLLRARAIENQLFVVAANACGVIGKLDFFGSSLVLGPRGEILAEGGYHPCEPTATLDPDEMLKWRESITCFQDRRPECY